MATMSSTKLESCGDGHVSPGSGDGWIAATEAEAQSSSRSYARVANERSPRGSLRRRGELAAEHAQPSLRVEQPRRRRMPPALLQRGGGVRATSVVALHHPRPRTPGSPRRRRSGPRSRAAAGPPYRCPVVGQRDARRAAGLGTAVGLDAPSPRPASKNSIRPASSPEPAVTTNRSRSPNTCPDPGYDPPLGPRGAAAGAGSRPPRARAPPPASAGVRPTTVGRTSASESSARSGRPSRATGKPHARCVASRARPNVWASGRQR